MEIVQTNTGQVKVQGAPNMCPFCHNTITPVYLYGHQIGYSVLEMILVCPNQTCTRSFIAFYENMGSYFTFQHNTTIGKIIPKNFNQAILDVSDTFSVIYNQAFAAEQYGLLEICGVGYRKALEFLIKDYAIFNNLDKKDTIEKKLLGQCITEFVKDSRIISVAKRAVWLGNDETHYIRKWEGKTLEDLKKLIELTVHWIEMESLTISFESEMPE